jgi:hypothetical protein
MLDGVHTSFDRKPCSKIAVRMRGDLALPGMCFRDDSLQLRRSELRDVNRISLGQHAARCADLDDVSAELELIAHSFATLIRAIADPFERGQGLHSVWRKRCAVAVTGG